ncbi:hypothetical protein K7432_016632 [Basidiobolus ranarum]|uniref:Uncharacterized protein n=1 Tax=Basidiobolus ranarum TaxID=34480 RepID=A0ABR2VLC8_9FUNG
MCDKRFFREVFLSLVDKRVRDGSTTGESRLSAKVRQAREKINAYKEECCKLASYAPIKSANAQQIAIYESIKIHTAYINKVALHFGNRLRMFLNKVLRKKRKD